jgi:hypothetical protein
MPNIFIYINLLFIFIIKMVALIIGTAVFIILWLIAAYIINSQVQRGVDDPKLKSEYRG